jgi:hypothetical protein
MSRLARCIHLTKHDHTSSSEGLCRLFFAFFCVLLAVYEDYRLNPRALLFAMGAFFFISIDKLIPRVGPMIDNPSVHTWDCPLYIFLLCGLPPVIATTTAVFFYEDVGSALHVLWSWGLWKFLLYLIPGALLLIIFNSSMNMSYPFHPNGAPGTLEDDGSKAKAAVAVTLQAGFWTVCLGVYLGEKNLIDWCQVVAFTLLYVGGAGPREIAFYPPRVMNLIARILRKPQLKISEKPWQLPCFLWSTTVMFVILISSTLLYFTTDVAYNRDSKTWRGLEEASLDSQYIPPQPFLLDVVIAHSNGDSVQSIVDLVSNFTKADGVRNQHARVKVYTKDQSLNLTSLTNLTSAYTERLTSQALYNSGGIAATYLHHMLFTWDFLPSQTLFLSTSSPSSFTPTTKARFDDYFVPTIPIHSERYSELVTSFLNLGEYSTCACESCADSTGWRDTFHLIPSMHGAAHDMSECQSVLLTHGNNFAASADRIRGLGRDVWQMLYDALTNPDVAHAWAHDKGKVKGPEGSQEWFGEVDSLENPYLGYTMERLWGVLLQCSDRGIAWRCPDTRRGWRRGGEKSDCSCLRW